MDDIPEVEISLVGKFKIIDKNGKDFTPRSRKACGIIALLSMSPSHTRTRKWLQDKLWSTREDGQGATSLRQSLSQIRRALGDYKDVLIADNFSVSLRTDSVNFDFDPNSDCDYRGKFPSGAEFLEDLDIADPEFEDWLRDQRSLFEECTGVFDAIDPVIERSNALISHDLAPLRHRLVLLPTERSSRLEVSFIADSLLDAVSKSITELGSVDVLDRRSPEPSNGQDFLTRMSEQALGLRAEVVPFNDRAIVRILLTDLQDNRLIVSEKLQLSKLDPSFVDDPKIMRSVAQITDKALWELGQTQSRLSGPPIASTLCQQGIRYLFKLGAENFKHADELFSCAYDEEQRGIYLAWRAYLRTFLLAERQYDCRETIQDESIEFMHRALEMDPNNSYIASLSAHVHIMMRRSYVAAYELADRSIKLNRANPFGWACFGIAKGHLGKPDEGFRYTLVGREIAGAAPFRFQLDGLSCIAGSMAGRFDDAMHCGLASHELAPDFAPPMRYLSALFLNDGDVKRSREMVAKLQRIEPDFSYDKLCDESYPTAGLQRSKIVDAVRRYL